MYGRENQLQDHFHPMNNYFRPVKPDSRFPKETPGSSNQMQDSKWTTQPTNEPRYPQYGFVQPTQDQQGRSTKIDFLPYHAFRQPHQSLNHDKKISFPSDDHSNADDLNQFPQPSYKNSKGSWKWIPDEEYNPSKLSDYHHHEPESKVTYSSHFLSESPRPQTSRDRPYSFDSTDSDSFNNPYHNQNSPSAAALTEYTKLPTGSATWASSGSDSLLTTEEHSGKHDEFIKNGHSTPKHLR